VAAVGHLGAVTLDTPDPQAHLGFGVADLVGAERDLLALGAAKPEFRPGGDKRTVLRDPAGRLFCVTTEM
jgi:hypothetical protein